MSTFGAVEFKANTTVALQHRAIEGTYTILELCFSKGSNQSFSLFVDASLVVCLIRNISPLTFNQTSRRNPEYIVEVWFTLSGNTVRVSYHSCIRHTLGMVFELHQSSENTHRYFHIIKK